MALTPVQCRPLRGSLPRGLRQGLRSLGAISCLAAANYGHSGIPEAGIQIELGSKVAVATPKVTLGDVAHIECADSEMRDRLKALPLGRVPLSGRMLYVSQATLQRWVHARLHIESKRMQWRGANACAIRLSTQTLSSDRLVQASQDALKRSMDHDSLTVTTRLIQVPVPVEVPAGQVELKVRGLGDISDWFSQNRTVVRRQTLWVDVWVDRRFVRSVALGYEFSAMGPGFIATRNVQIGESLAAKDMKPAVVDWADRKPLATLPRKTSESLREPKGKSTEPEEQWIATRSLKAGEVISHRDVVNAPHVKQGEMATLRSQQGLIALESRVEVLQDGSAGQRVRVKISNGTSSIHAWVVGPGLVEVRP